MRQPSFVLFLLSLTYPPQALLLPLAGEGVDGLLRSPRLKTHSKLVPLMVINNNNEAARESVGDAAGERVDEAAAEGLDEAANE